MCNLKYLYYETYYTSRIPSNIARVGKYYCNIAYLKKSVCLSLLVVISILDIAKT